MLFINTEIYETIIHFGNIKNLDITPTSTAVSVILTYVIYLISAVHRNA